MAKRIALIFALLPATADAVDYARDIRPILASRCHSCHGPAKQKGELRLDRKRDALEGGSSGRVIVPGNAAASRLHRLIAGLEKDLVMPPEGPRLDPRDVETIRAWIDAGAPWPDGIDPAEDPRSTHWAFQPITRPDPPSTRRAEWVRSPIDAFVLGRMEREGLSPSPEADRATLARRLSLDLTGLPPSPEDVDAFAADERPDAHERFVEGLLASPHFGERWARWWLDLARYADTNGYEKDKPRVMWRYRDWVIDALNQDLPFDRFTIEQLAGDMLPGATASQRIATGFHRNTMVNDEGGADQEQFRYEAIVDRVSTTGTAFLGLTLGCAQCHSHKYDPISHREFFQLYAFFNNADEPLVEAPMPEEAVVREAHLARVANAEAELCRDPAIEDGHIRHGDEELADANAAEPAWEADLAPLARPWVQLEPAGFASEGGAQHVVLPDGSILVEGPSPGADTYDVDFQAPGGAITGIKIEALPHESLPGGGPGRGRILGDGNFVLSEVTLPGSAFSHATADFAQKGFEAEKAIDGDLESGWSIEAGKPGKNVARSLVLELAEPFVPEQGTRIRLRLVHNYTHEHNLGRFRISATAGPKPVKASGLPPDVEAALLLPRALRTADQSAAVKRCYRFTAPGLAEAQKKLAELRAAAPRVTTAMVMRERKQPRVTRIKVRGDFMRDGDVVEAGVPAFLPPLPGGVHRDRLALARWIVDPRNPLTARVVVNRVWQAYFGRGLVATPEDFGTRCEPPSHPELLDWLAGELVRSGWSLKALHRLIAGSAVYRQSSRVTPELLGADPQNVSLARGPRFRVDAECVRDIALAATGLLSRKVGGPSVFPPLPDGLGDLSFGGVEWKASDGDDRHRRGLYTYWKRTNPYPAFVTFDAPAGTAACSRRTRSTTPLQALTLLNDEAFVEAARALAERVLREAADTPSRARRAFRLCTAREPDAEEMSRMTEFVSARLAAAGTDAGADTSAGADGNAAEREETAWMLLARVLLNLDETVTKG